MAMKGQMRELDAAAIEALMEALNETDRRS